MFEGVHPIGRGLAVCVLAWTAGCAGTPPGSGGGDAAETRAVRLTGDAYHWKAAYPGPDGVWGSADDRVAGDDIRIPAGRPFRLELTSRDYIYTLDLDELDVHELAVPERLYSVTLPELERRDYPFRGDQLCGYTHETLMGRLVAMPGAEFDRWVAALPSRPQDVIREVPDEE